MDHFTYRDGKLFCEDVSVDRIAEQVGTPVYVYSRATLLHHYRQVADAFAPLSPIVCYSVKSNGNLHLCRLLAEAGAGFDVVSGGELYRALAAGGEPGRIVFAGVGKTDAEIRQGIAAGIALFNIESEAELANVDRLARELGRPVAAALRVNPDVDPRTHRYIATGKKETKFGVDIERARAVFAQHGQCSGSRVNPLVASDGGRNKAGLHLCGVHIHIGSQITQVAPYVEAVGKTLALIADLRRSGHAIEWFDLGGGFGIDYQDRQALPAGVFAEALVPLIKPLGLKVAIEPGRYIVGNAGVLISTALYVKQGGEKTFVIVDAGMNDLIRPALYGAYHFIWPTQPANGFVPPAVRTEAEKFAGLQPADVVGPVCESGDFFAQDRPLPPLARGQRIAIFSAGAYGLAMASNYNARPRPPEVLVEGDRFRVIRRRETYDDLVAPER